MNNDQKMEDQIKQRGLTAPRITLDHVKQMIENRVTYRVEQPAHTTSTFVHAFLDDTFYLATGHTACVSKENFNAELGREYATRNAKGLASDKLYELEGYRLFTRLQEYATHE